jgi:hypothetical protein
MENEPDKLNAVTNGVKKAARVRKVDKYFLVLFLAGFAAAASYLLNLPSFAYLIIGALFACTVLYIHQVQPTA